nr:MAG TPA_asm: hypothetical protein [Caudoviricetes sp.]
MLEPRRLNIPINQPRQGAFFVCICAIHGTTGINGLR